MFQLSLCSFSLYFSHLQLNVRFRLLNLILASVYIFVRQRVSFDLLWPIVYGIFSSNFSLFKKELELLHHMLSTAVSLLPLLF